MSDPLAWLDDALADLDRRGLRRKVTARGYVRSLGTIEFGDERLVNFGSNDYLGLAVDPEVTNSFRDLYADFGAGASPLVTGRTALHKDLEIRLAEFEGTESAMLFPTGYAANAGTIPALVGSGDAIYSDARNHASIIDGSRLSGAAIHVYRHCDSEHLCELLSTAGSYRRRLVVTDSVFSMDGDFAPLPQLVGLANQFGAMILIDEAHATGVFGNDGRGLAQHFDVEAQVDIRIGTLSKAVGGLGGFVAGQNRLIEWLANRARTYGFSTAAPLPVVQAARTALAIVQSQPERRIRLLKNAAAFRAALLERGLDIGNSASQIVPVILGDADRTMAAAAELRRRGFFVPGIRPPSVPEGQSLLRISLTCLHSKQQIDALVAALVEIAQ